MIKKKKQYKRTSKKANYLLATLLSTLEPPPLTLEQLRIKEQLELGSYIAHNHFEHTA